MIPVKIIKRIYIRKGPGKSFDDVGSTMPSGDIVNMEGTELGENINGINTWYYLTNTNGVRQYYWGGGVQVFDDLISVLSIEKIWNQGEMGDLATVAVLDSGIAVACTDLTDAIASGIIGGFKNADRRMKNFLPDSKTIDDDLGHGSHCSGLIASRNKLQRIGIAKQCKLYIGKITDSGNSPSVANMIKGIRWAAGLDDDAPQDIDIISMSAGSLLNIPDMQPTIDAAISRGKILIFSIGNRDPDSLPEGGNYPALCSGAISVGAVDQQNAFQSFSYQSPNLTIAAPGSKINSYWINGQFHIESGTSQSTAVCAGVVALLVSKLKKKGEPNVQKKIMELLLKSDLKNGTDGFQYRYIDALKLFNLV
jgi:subtilisin family serine protease